VAQTFTHPKQLYTRRHALEHIFLPHAHMHTQPFYGTFSGTTQVRWCQKKSFSGLYGAREDNIGRHTDHPAGCNSIQTHQRPTSIISHFYAGCPSCCNPPTLSSSKYAGLHTQWRGYTQWIISVTSHCKQQVCVCVNEVGYECWLLYQYSRRSAQWPHKAEVSSMTIHMAY